MYLSVAPSQYSQIELVKKKNSVYYYLFAIVYFPIF